MNTFIPVETLRSFMEKTAAAAGLPAPDAAILADNLLTADLWGIGSHGTSRFPIYWGRIQKKLNNPAPNIQITKKFPAVLKVDGDNGLGAVVTYRALEAAMETAKTQGIAFVGVYNSNHFGAAGYFCNLAANEGFGTIITTVGLANMPPFGGAEAYFSTNPIAFGMPAEDGHIIVDMATSVAAKGKIREIARKGGSIPEGWALDENGNPTTNAEAALKGLVLPMAGHKGSGLALAVEFMAGVLTGGGFGEDIEIPTEDNRFISNFGHCMIVYRKDAFLSEAQYNERMNRLCCELSALRPTQGFDRVILPGEPERARAKAVLEQGISVDEKLLESLRGIAEKTGIGLG